MKPTQITAQNAMVVSQLEISEFCKSPRALAGLYVAQDGTGVCLCV
jgi:hypothetical protein